MTAYAARIAPVLIGGVALCGLQFFRLVTAPPEAAHGWLIGSFVGCVVGTIIGVVLAARAKPLPPKPAPPPEKQQQDAEKYKDWAKRSYIFCAVCWVAVALMIAPLSLWTREEMPPP